MKRVQHLCLILCFLLLLQLWTVPVFASADASVESGCRGLDAKVPLLGTGQLVENGEAVLLLEAKTDTLMYAWNADAPMYPASLVKIMTALIAAEQGTMTDVVTVSAAALSTVPSEATSVDLQADEVLPLEDLLYCMMVESANDAAVVIAEHIAGSQNAFVAQMNAYAQELGCTGTNYTNATGLHDDLQVTTARDTARILAAALKNELFCTLFGTTHYTVAATNKSEERKLSTGNHMMHMDIYEIYYDERVTGGRTGVTTNGDNCIAVTAESNGLQLISVILGAESTYTDDGNAVRRIGGFGETTELLNQGFTGFKTAQLLYDNQALIQYTVAEGNADVIAAPKISVSSVLPQAATVADLSYRYREIPGALNAPVEKDQQLSTVEIWCDTVCVAQADLYALNAVAHKPAQTITGDEDDTDGALSAVLTGVLLTVGVLILAVLLLRLVGKIRVYSKRNRSRRHRRNRRRSR